MIKPHAFKETQSPPSSSKNTNASFALSTTYSTCPPTITESAFCVRQFVGSWKYKDEQGTVPVLKLLRSEDRCRTLESLEADIRWRSICRRSVRERLGPTPKGGQEGNRIRDIELWYSLSGKLQPTLQKVLKLRWVSDVSVVWGLILSTPVLISYWRVTTPEKGHDLAQGALFNKGDGCRELSAEGCLWRHLQNLREYVLRPEVRTISFGVGAEETGNYTKMSLDQPWRYVQSIVDALKGNLFQSWESWKTFLNRLYSTI